MSNANAIGANTGYPQANIRTGAYATPFQQPISQNVVTGAQDTAVDPYTGQYSFAGGGYMDFPGLNNSRDEDQGMPMPMPDATFDPAQNPAQSQPQEMNTGAYTGQTMFADGGNIGGFSYDPSSGLYSSREPTQSGDGGGNAGAGFFGLTEEDIRDTLGIKQAQRQYANNSIGGYTFDPATGTYGRSQELTHTATPAEVQATAEPYNDYGSNGGLANGGGISALGGRSNLGGYSDGGQLLRGPGDGVSDNIPAMIGNKQHARLADGEFVVPARIVSELGNGSTEAGSRQLYAMMDRVQNARKKSIGKGKVATNSRAAKLLPA